jgi:hypothetical protein
VGILSVLAAGASPPVSSDKPGELEGVPELQEIKPKAKIIVKIIPILPGTYHLVFAL